MNALTWRLVLGVSRFAKGLHVIGPQTVRVEDVFGDDERILDLGGGGEGVIGQLRGRQVTAVDIRQEELDEAPAGPTKGCGRRQRLAVSRWLIRCGDCVLLPDVRLGIRPRRDLERSLSCAAA